MTVHEPHARIVAPAPEDEPRARGPGGRGREGVSQLRVDEVEGARVGRLGLGDVGPGEGAHALAEDVEVAPVDVHRVGRPQRCNLQDVVHPHAPRGVRYSVVVLAAWLGAQQEGAEVLCFQGQDGLVEGPVDDLAANYCGQLVSHIRSLRNGVWEIRFDRVGVEDLDIGRSVLANLVDVRHSRLCRLGFPEDLKIKERVGKDHLGVSGTRNPHRVLSRLLELGEKRVPLPVVDFERLHRLGLDVVTVGRDHIHGEFVKRELDLLKRQGAYQVKHDPCFVTRGLLSDVDDFGGAFCRAASIEEFRRDGGVIWWWRTRGSQFRDH